MTPQADTRIDPAELRRCLSRALDRLVAVPGLRYRIDEIELVPERSAATGRTVTVIRVAVTTNNRPLVLGQFLGFPAGGLRGYHPNYLFGYVHGYYESRYGLDLWAGFRIVLDVTEVGDGPQALYRYLTVDEAVRERLLCPGSPLWTSMRRYGLRYLLASGSVLSGPSIAMISALEQVVEGCGITSMVDAYAGTCSLAKVACAHGAARVTCVDPGLDVDKARQNLGEFSGRCRLVARDAHSLPWRGPVDLLVVDPFYEFALDALRAVVAPSSGGFRYLVFNLGPPVERYWTARLRRELDEMDLVPLSTFSHGDDVVLCQARPAGRPRGVRRPQGTTGVVT